MKSLGRMIRSMRADIDDIIDEFFVKVSDPEKILQSIIENMQENRLYVHGLVSEAIANQQRNKLSYYEAISQFNYWQEQVLLAQQSGDIYFLARASDYAKYFRNTASILKTGLDYKSFQITEFQENLIQIDREIFEIKVRLNLLKERLQLVETKEEIRHLNSILGSLSRRNFKIGRVSGDLSNP